MVFTLFCSLLIWDTCMYTQLLRSCWFRLFWVATILQFCHLAKTIKLRLTEKKILRMEADLYLFVNTDQRLPSHARPWQYRGSNRNNVLRVESLIHVPTRLNWTWSVETDMGQARVN